MALEQQGGDRLCFGGRVRRYTHASAVLGCNMVLSVFIPPNASDSNKAPVRNDARWSLSCARDWRHL